MHIACIACKWNEVTGNQYMNAAHSFPFFCLGQCAVAGGQPLRPLPRGFLLDSRQQPVAAAGLYNCGFRMGCYAR